MIKIGNYNKLRIERTVDFGAYLKSTDTDSNEEILLPRRYLEPSMKVGDEIEVFVYRDSEDRPVATTEKPFVTVGEFAFLQTVQVNKVGAFLDWGLPKNLLVPFKEQKIKMFPGGIYLVYVYLDHNTGRVVASAKIEKFLDNVFPEYKKGEKVDTLIIGHNDIGYQVVVDNRHRGMIYTNEIYQPLEIGQTVSAYVKNVRDEDGRIDLTLTAPGTIDRVEKVAEKILDALNRGAFGLTDDSTPEEIKKKLQCSKKDFKKAVGLLYRQHKIVIDSDGEIFAV